MVYVQRTNGVVSGVFMNPQPGYAEETLAEDHAEVVAYLAGPTLLQRIAAARDNASSQVDAQADVPMVLLRAVLLTLLDELNILRQRDRDRATDVAAATSLADLKTRWAARSSLADRTVAQAKSAVQSKITGGDAD